MGKTQKTLSMVLSGKKIILGVTGGIAAYKSAELVRGLIKKKAVVRVVMTESAARFVTPLTFEVLSQNKVCTDLWDSDSSEIDHIAISAESDIFIIAPATANTIGKIANGLADNILTNLFLAFKGSVFICPSMNSNMYLHPSVRSNMKTLRDRGSYLIEPEFGDLACGEEGIGRLPEPDSIIRGIEYFLKKKRELTGKKVIVTAGPTREFIDAVRFVANPSSGKMGYAIAEEAARRNAEVVLVSGPSPLDQPPGVKRISVTSAAEMCKAVLDNLEKTDIAIMAAAVSDYKPVSRVSNKIKKKKENISLEMEPNPDILESLGKRENGFFLVGFAAETSGLLKKTREKMLRKNCSLMIGNLINKTRGGFESDENEIIIVSRNTDQVDTPPLMTKRDAAIKIMDRIVGEINIDKAV